MQGRKNDFDKHKSIKRPKAKSPMLQKLIDTFDLVVEKKGVMK